MGINQAVSERRAALAAAQELIAKAQAASNSADYADEIDTLDQVITNAAKGDADALTSDIIASTKLLDDAVNADMNSALAALAQDSSPVSNEADVIAAKATLQNSVDSNSATLVADTNNYLSVLAAAKITRSDAQTAAQDAMDRTVPNNKAAIIKAQGLLEQVVTDAVTALNEVLNNPASTTADILAATETFKDVVNQAKDSRNDAVDEAETLITNIDSISKRPGVKEKLDDAASGSENVLTADIKDTVQELREISENVQNVLDDANNHLTEDFANPVNKEPGVKDATDKLKDLVNDPTASIDDVQKAIDAMDTVIEQAKVERNQAIKDAENAENALKEYGNTGELGNLIQ